MGSRIDEQAVKVQAQVRDVRCVHHPTEAVEPSHDPGCVLGWNSVREHLGQVLEADEPVGDVHLDQELPVL